MFNPGIARLHVPDERLKIIGLPGEIGGHPRLDESEQQPMGPRGVRYLLVGNDVRRWVHGVVPITNAGPVRARPRVAFARQSLEAPPANPVPLANVPSCA